MNNCIFTIKIGNNQNWDLCIKSQQLYCERYGITHIVVDKFRVNWPFGPTPVANFYFEKLQAFSLSKAFDRVLYMDSDILITPHAKNIFDVYTDKKSFYAFDESMEVGIKGKTLFGTEEDIMDRDPYVKPIIPTIGNWKKNQLGKYIYYNMGVMLFGDDFFNLDDKKIVSLNNVSRIYDFNDQTYFNALIQKYNISNHSLDYSFNRMNLGRRDENNERYTADFIHYAGPCLYGINGEYSEEGKKLSVYKDYTHFYGS